MFTQHLLWHRYLRRAVLAAGSGNAAEERHSQWLQACYTIFSRCLHLSASENPEVICFSRGMIHRVLGTSLEPVHCCRAPGAKRLSGNQLIAPGIAGDNGAPGSRSGTLTWPHLETNQSLQREKLSCCCCHVSRLAPGRQWGIAVRWEQSLPHRDICSSSKRSPCTELCLQQKTAEKS